MGITPKELEAIKDHNPEFSSDEEKQLWLDAFRGARDDGDSIQEAIEYADDVYQDMEAR